MLKPDGHPKIAAMDFKQFLIILLLSFTFLLPSSSQAQLIKPNSEAVETSGDIILYTLPASALSTTLIMKDYKGTWQFTKSFVLNAAVTAALKYALNKPRPFGNGYQAFPSGHTSITFQSAAFVHRRYGFKYSIPGYILAGWTGYSRINATRHDGYDILAGAVVGIGSSFLLSTPYQQEHMKLSFRSSKDHYLLGFVYTF